MSDFRERSWGKYNRKPFTPFLKRNHGFNWMDEGGYQPKEAPKAEGNNDLDEIEYPEEDINPEDIPF
jgi:hypothetical protein